MLRLPSCSYYDNNTHTTGSAKHLPHLHIHISRGGMLLAVFGLGCVRLTKCDTSIRNRKPIISCSRGCLWQLWHNVMSASRKQRDTSNCKYKVRGSAWPALPLSICSIQPLSAPALLWGFCYAYWHSLSCTV